MKQQKQHNIVENLKKWLHKVLPEKDMQQCTKRLEQEQHGTPSLAASSLSVEEVRGLFGL
jgi:hypothetical protein